MINDISNNSSTYKTVNQKNGSVMGKDDFLKLMLAQLKNQDPLNPMEGTEFASQLAQFTSLEQLVNLNDAMNTSINSNYYLTQSINNTLAATLIGKEAKLNGNSVQFDGQDSVQLNYNLSSDANNITINIYNENGKLIKSIDNASRNSGNSKLIWDFTDNEGKKVGFGKYKFEVDAKNSDNEPISNSTFVLGKIEGVKFTENGTMLVVDGVQYYLSDIMEIYDAKN